MSANPQVVALSPRGPDVLGELLHSLSQPLTSLRCSLELSLDRSIAEVQGQPDATFAVALQQTEKVIGMVGLMREYLDAEQPGPASASSALSETLWRLSEELSSIAVVRGVQLRLVGTCSAMMAVPEPRLRLALQYLITSMIDAQPVGGKVMLLLGEGPAGAVLRGEGARGVKTSSTNPRMTLRDMRIAIASRVLETAGASLVLSGNPIGFVLRVPRSG
jgi:signal transduction histidine kinase